MYESNEVFINDHPLIKHKITRLRDQSTGTSEFRSLVGEISMLMGYEALRDLPVEDIEVQTPIETCKSPIISGRKLAIVPILRAGLGMVDGILALVPNAPLNNAVKAKAGLTPNASIIIIPTINAIIIETSGMINFSMIFIVLFIIIHLIVSCHCHAYLLYRRITSRKFSHNLTFKHNQNTI